MGQVFLAEQVNLKRQVAVKVMRPELAANAVHLQRFRMEAKAVARLNHPNIVQVYSIGSDSGLDYIALEYVEGFTLRTYLTRRGNPPLPLALSIMRQVAAALQEACSQGIVHRDIKPGNILLSRKGEAKVADFGLARCFTDEEQGPHITRSGTYIGTPVYSSPEQVRGFPVDTRSDIYSFGATCFHMLAGRPPFRSESAMAVALQHVEEEPPALGLLRPDLPEELCGIVHKMLAKDPADRQQNGRELLADLSQLKKKMSTREPVPAVAVAPRPVLPAWLMDVAQSEALDQPGATPAILDWLEDVRQIEEQPGPSAPGPATTLPYGDLPL